MHIIAVMASSGSPNLHSSMVILFLCYCKSIYMHPKSYKIGMLIIGKAIKFKD